MKQLCAALVVLAALAARPIAQAPAAIDIVGSWDITTVSPLGENTNTIVIAKDGDALKAVAKSPDGERPYDKIELAGAKVKIVLTVEYEGSPMIITYTGAADGKVMSGEADFGGLAQGTWSAARQ
jgi:hypothetical protein